MKQKSSALSLATQKSFFTIALVAYAGMLFSYGQVIYQISRTLADLNTYLLVMIWAGIMPLIFFGVSWLFTSNQPRVSRLFATTVYALLAILLYSIVSSLTWLISNQLLLYEYNQLVQSTVPLGITVVGFIALLIYNRRITKAPAVSPFIEWTYTVFGIGLFILEFAQDAYRILAQLPTNTNLSGFYPVIIQSILLPLILFLIAYFWIAKSPVIRTRLFRATLFATAGFMMYTVLSSISQFIATSLQNQTLMYSTWGFVGFMIGGAVLTIIIYVLWLASLQRNTSLK